MNIIEFISRPFGAAYRAAQSLIFSRTISRHVITPAGTEQGSGAVSGLSHLQAPESLDEAVRVAKARKLIAAIDGDKLEGAGNILLTDQGTVHEVFEVFIDGTRVTLACVHDLLDPEIVYRPR